MNTYVKTVYEDKSQKANITRYTSKEVAKNMIAAYAEWGIDIESCKVIPEEEAFAQIRAKTVTYDRA